MVRFWLKLGLALALIAMPIGARAEKVLRVVPHADLKIVDPYTTTATITLMHGQMIYDQLFAWNSRLEPKPQMVDSYQISSDRLVYTSPCARGSNFTTASRSPPATSSPR
jgi:peptide/nickel transport system substrate-binding protein